MLTHSPLCTSPSWSSQCYHCSNLPQNLLKTSQDLSQDTFSKTTQTTPHFLLIRQSISCNKTKTKYFSQHVPALSDPQVMGRQWWNNKPPQLSLTWHAPNSNFTTKVSQRPKPSNPKPLTASPSRISSSKFSRSFLKFSRAFRYF